MTETLADPLEPLEQLFRDLRASPHCLSSREAARRLEVSGPNTVEVDMSTLTGESAPVIRSADTTDAQVPLLHARDVAFSGSECTGGEAQAVVTATGMGTELGRIAALSQRVGREESPLEHQVKRAAWLIAFVAVGAGLAFLPLGLAAGLAWPRRSASLSGC